MHDCVELFASLSPLRNTSGVETSLVCEGYLSGQNEVVKITSEDGLTTPESVQLLVTSPRNNVEVIVDTDAMLWIMFTAHDTLQVPVFKVNESVNEPLSRPRGIYGPQTNLAENVGCKTDADEDESPSKSEGRDVRNENVQ
ncbi:hypothetical protein WN943_026278 [Citrus x changshan-huyou]